MGTSGILIIGQFLCRIGLHKWSDHMGGIQICRRDDCRSAKTFGLTGAMRQIEFERELYEEYQSYTGRSGGGDE